MPKKPISQEIKSIIILSDYIEYSDKKEIARLSRLTTSQVYHTFNNHGGKKNFRKIINTTIQLLKSRGIYNTSIKSIEKKFAPSTTK